VADDVTNMVNALSAQDQAAMQPETFVNPMVKALIEGAAANVAKPGQMMTPNPYPPGSEENDWFEGQRTKGMGDWAPRTAVSMLGGGMPFAEPGAAGIFGGKLAQTADLKALQEAQKMQSAGAHPVDIWQNTGWFQHPADNQWRFEIPDNKSALRYQAGNPRSLDSSVVAGPSTEMFSHPDLYKAYPELHNIKMWSRNDPRVPNGEGSYEPNIGHLGEIDVNAPDLVTGRSVALHELQHATQNIEGFHPGSSPQFWDKFKQQHSDQMPPDLASQTPISLYKKTAGEVESRNVEKRKDFSPQERMQNHPLTTQDTPVGNTLSMNLSNKPIDPVLLNLLRNNK
jgi:hypothetical protein